MKATPVYKSIKVTFATWQALTRMSAMTGEHRQAIMARLVDMEEVMEQILAAQVSMILSDMSDQEVLAQRLALLLDTDHIGRYGYEKIKPLLTQDGETKMHEIVRDAFLAQSGARLGV